VLLDHQPGFFAEEKAAGADLILCGHTHRGQIFPMGLITRAIYRPDYGMKREDGCTMIVTSGVGTWGPRVRTCSSGEVAVITLTPRA
jgi:predicted MPP superfamily phosphohydrolase